MHGDGGRTFSDMCRDMVVTSNTLDLYHYTNWTRYQIQSNADGRPVHVYA